MARPSLSPLGPRRQIACQMTAAQRALLTQARARGWSKQEIATVFLPKITASDLVDAAAWGAGARKTVVWRLPPEVIDMLRERKRKTASTYPLLLEAAIKKAIATPKPAP